MLYGNLVKRVCTVGWAFVGLIVAAMVAQGHASAAALGDPENAFGFACRQLLFPGALGLMIASILAANMSTCSAFLVDSGALFTEGLYRQRLVPNRPDRHYLWVGRISGFVITMAGVLYAMYLIESVLYTFLLTETLATFVGISVLGGIIWPRANRWGALASLLSSLATNFILYRVTGQRLDHWDANVFLAALARRHLALGRRQSAHRVRSRRARSTRSSHACRRRATVQRGGRGCRRCGKGTSAEPIGRCSWSISCGFARSAAAGRGWRAFREDLVGFATAWAHRHRPGSGDRASSDAVRLSRRQIRETPGVPWREMIAFSEISKQYGRQVLFVDASFQLNPGEKIGLVGPNGAGKTTLFRMITGEETPDEGDVSVPKRLTIGYFRQDVEEMSGRSVLDEAIAGSGRVGALHHELEAAQSGDGRSGPRRRHGLDSGALWRSAGGVRAPRRLCPREPGARSPARARVRRRADRRRRRRALGRMEDARRHGARAPRPARRAAARRADQPPRHRIDHLARGVSEVAARVRC